jgi:cytidylate kinase
MRELADARATGVIAVDGPTAAGKTTTSRRIAAILAIPYLESGRTYRLVAYTALERGVDVTDEEALSKICDTLLAERAYEAILSAHDNDAAFLRTPEVTRAVSPVASAPRLREKVTTLTRSWAKLMHTCVIEGRDIGTVVFPDAPVKVFLTALPEVRARRRHAEEAWRPYQEILNELMRRDQADSTRRAAPLVPADDAKIIDTSDMSIHSVVTEMVRLCVAAGVSSSDHLDKVVRCSS